VVAGTSRDVIHVFDLGTGVELERRRAPDQVWSLAISGRGAIAAGTRSGQVALWPPGRTVQLGTEPVTELCFFGPQRLAGLTSGGATFEIDPGGAVTRTGSGAAAIACRGAESWVAERGGGVRPSEAPAARSEARRIHLGPGVARLAAGSGHLEIAVGTDDGRVIAMGSGGTPASRSAPTSAASRRW
jgi:hypothetical protein